jgi:hypothetical protein
VFVLAHTGVKDFPSPVPVSDLLVSGIPAPHFEDESSLVRGSEVVQGSSGCYVSF